MKKCVPSFAPSRMSSSPSLKENNSMTSISAVNMSSSKSAKTLISLIAFLRKFRSFSAFLTRCFSRCGSATCFDSASDAASSPPELSSSGRLLTVLFRTYEVGSRILVGRFSSCASVAGSNRTRLSVLSLCSDMEPLIDDLLGCSSSSSSLSSSSSSSSSPSSCQSLMAALTKEVGTRRLVGRLPSLMGTSSEIDTCFFLGPLRRSSSSIPSSSSSSSSSSLSESLSLSSSSSAPLLIKAVACRVLTGRVLGPEATSTTSMELDVKFT
mmetsp:Transcript_6939/g.19150  ORF Transcript_6939/g.19150 Transcript_6939/m.19150 type:complete len:268 (+) Transcript_6939:307-1110(+)